MVNEKFVMQCLGLLPQMEQNSLVEKQQRLHMEEKELASCFLLYYFVIQIQPNTEDILDPEPSIFNGNKWDNEKYQTNNHLFNVELCAKYQVKYVKDTEKFV